MGIRWTVVLVGALTGACTGTESSAGGSTPPPSAAGMAGAGTDAGSSAGASPAYVETGGTGGVEVPAAGSGTAGKAGGGTGMAGAAGTAPAAGSHAPVGGQGGAAHGGSGGTPSGGSGGQTAPTEHVLWSQRFMGTLEPGMLGFPDATMGLALDASDLCKFGFNGAASGTSQTFVTDGACITASPSRQGVAVVFDQSGTMYGGSVARAPLASWPEAVTGHTVKYLKRTQIYSLTYIGGDVKSNYGTFDGTWEAWGY